MYIHSDKKLDINQIACTLLLPVLSDLMSLRFRSSSGSSIWHFNLHSYTAHGSDPRTFFVLKRQPVGNLCESYIYLLLHP